MGVGVPFGQKAEASRQVDTLQRRSFYNQRFTSAGKFQVGGIRDIDW